MLVKMKQKAKQTFLIRPSIGVTKIQIAGFGTIILNKLSSKQMGFDFSGCGHGLGCWIDKEGAQRKRRAQRIRMSKRK